MTPATLTTILNSAPLIIQAAGKLMRLMRDKQNDSDPASETLPVTVEGLKRQIKQLEARLYENHESDVEQIRLIEQLAKQNESLAETLQQTCRKITVLTYLSVVAVAMSGLAMLVIFT